MPLNTLNTLKNAESGRGRAKRHARHHFSPSASFRVFRGPLHGLMPLKNAEKR
jgi:hypothetical protein